MKFRALGLIAALSLTLAAPALAFSPAPASEIAVGQSDELITQVHMRHGDRGRHRGWRRGHHYGWAHDRNRGHRRHWR